MKEKKGRSIFFRIIIAILVLIVLSIFGFQHHDANTMISEIKEVNPIFAIRQNTIIDNEKIYYIYQDNGGEITYLRHIEKPYHIKALKEAKLLSQIVEKRISLVK